MELRVPARILSGVPADRLKIPENLQLRRKGAHCWIGKLRRFGPARQVEDVPPV